jgi:hypothetical protein
LGFFRAAPIAKHGDHGSVRPNLDKVSGMADEQREHRAKKNIYAFLQRRSIEQRRSYLARGRRFVVLDVGQLSKSWITAVKNWLARKDRANEVTMDDLTAELRLRGLEPPYDAVTQELATRFGRINGVSQEKAEREFARQIGRFTREKDKPLH